MLMPKKVKHRKQQRGRMRGNAKGGTTVTFGDYGIQALEPGWITARQIEAARIAMTRHIKRGGKVWINIFPDKPVTEKPAETRMGSGKGNPERWVAVVKPGRIMFELSGVNETLAKEALSRASRSCPSRPASSPARGGLMATGAEVRELDDGSCSTTWLEPKQELFNLRFQHVTGQLDNYRRLGQVRKDIARINTVLREREIAEARDNRRTADG